MESAVSLTKSLRWEIQALGQRLAAAANAEELVRSRNSKVKDRTQHELELKRIVADIQKLLVRIEDAVPLINLAITASGASLSSSLPSTVSPSRLLQASTFLTAGDSQYSVSRSHSVQIGPSFLLSMYMLFIGHLRPQNEEDIRESTWKEVIHKARVKLVRVPIEDLYSMPGKQHSAEPEGMVNREDPHSSSLAEERGYFPSHVEAEAKADEYAYQLLVVEDLDDDRLHTFEDNEPQPGPYEDVELAGIREAIPIHEISKIFYADTGKILNIGTEGETNNPVLLLKRDLNAIPPRRMMQRLGEENDEEPNPGGVNDIVNSVEGNGEDLSQSQIARLDYDHQPSSPSPLPSPPEQHITKLLDPWRIPADLDPEWLAFEVYTETPDSDADSSDEQPLANHRRSSHTSSLDPQTSALTRLSLQSPSSQTTSSHQQQPTSTPLRAPTLPPIRTSLSLLETLLRLLSLQQFQQAPHLSIPDELLTFFLSESASTGAANGDSQERKRLRTEARRRVGFDPYDESPVKRRGEEYQYRGSGEGEYEGQQAWEEGNYEGSRVDPVCGSPLRYNSLRDDEGYDTHRFSPSPRRPPSPSPRSETPPLLLKNHTQSQSFRGSTPERSPTGGSGGGGGRYASNVAAYRWRGGRRDYGNFEAGRRGSPLARPGTGVTDEGLGTSPASSAGSGGK